MGERAQEAEGKGQRWREESWGKKIWNTHTRAGKTSKIEIERQK